jgi:hypothetical protein
MKRLLIAAIALCAIGTVPVTSVALNPPQEKQSEGKGHDAASQNNGNVKPSATKPEGGVPSETKTSEENHTYNYDHASEPDWWARIAEIIAALATVALAIIGFFGVRAALDTLSAIRKQTRSIHHQAVQVRKQTRLLRISAQVAERTIILQYRPRLAIRSINVGNWMVADIINEEPVVTVDLTIANIGASEARIVDSKITFWPNIPRGPITVQDAGGTIGVFMLEAGRSVERTVSVDRSMNNLIRQRVARSGSYGASVGSAYCVGWIRYLDKDGMPRTRGFIRVMEGMGFVPLPSPRPDYEYDD